VTLRSEIHSAIDDVAPPAPALPREAVAFVRSNGMLRTGKPDRRQFPWALGMRRTGSLVAAVLVVVMVAAVVFGGRLWRDWNAQQQNAARQVHVAELHKRPLLLPFVDPGAACPESQRSFEHGGYGGGPLYAQGSGQRFGVNSGTYFTTSFWADYSYTGRLVLIRGRDLKTNQSIVFAKSPYPGAVSSGIPSGNVLGTEVVFGVKVELHPELILDASVRLPPPNDAWEALEGFPNGSSGCIGIQADGFNGDGSAFSEIIVVNYLLLS
jgi:hypothetical protein